MQVGGEATDLGSAERSALSSRCLGSGPNRAERSRSSQSCKEEPRFCFYLHQLLFLLLAGADGVSDGAHLRQDGLRLLQLVAIRAVGDLLVDPGGQREDSRKKGNLEIKNKEAFP